MNSTAIGGATSTEPKTNNRKRSKHLKQVKIRMAGLEEQRNKSHNLSA